MKKINLLIGFLLLIKLESAGKDYLVTTSEELIRANSMAKPGDQIILKKGEWKNLTIRLTCQGTSSNPIIIKAEEEGKAILSGNSKLKRLPRKR